MSRRLSLLGPPLLTARTAHFPPPLLLPPPLPPSRPSDLSLPPPALHQTRPWGFRQWTDITSSCAIVGSCFLSLPPFSLCSPLSPAHDWERSWKSRPLRRPPPLPPIRPPPRPPCAIRKAHFALRLLPCPPLAFPSPPTSHSQYISAAPPERTIPREQNKQPVLCDRRTGLAPVPPCLPSEPGEAIGLLQSTARFTTSLPFFYHGDRRPSTICAP